MTEDQGRRRFIVVGVALALGVLAWIAEAVGGDERGGIISFAIMAAYALGLLIFGGRSDLVSSLAGAPPDERFQALDLRALAVTGLALILYVIGGFLWEQAHGRSGAPFTLMGAVAGLVYIAALVYGRVRG